MNGVISGQARHADGACRACKPIRGPILKSPPDSPHFMDARFALFVVSLAVGLIIYVEPLRRLIALSLESHTHSYIVAMPFIALFSLAWKRNEIFRKVEYSYAAGSIWVFLSLALHAWCRMTEWNANADEGLVLSTLSAVGFITGTLVFFYGVNTFRNALTPVLFLVLMVPLPAPVLDALTAFLQRGSLDAAYWIFRTAGIPVSLDGSVLMLPFIDLEVAPECSGIRSTMALFIVSLLIGAVYLKSAAGRVVLLLSSVAISIFKNGMRIVFLYVIAANFGERVLAGPWHTRGGNIFFVVALLLLSPVAWGLRALERRRRLASSCK